jgi:hypothetical protein
MTTQAGIVIVQAAISYTGGLSRLVHDFCPATQASMTGTSFSADPPHWGDDPLKAATTIGRLAGNEHQITPVLQPGVFGFARCGGKPSEIMEIRPALRRKSPAAVFLTDVRFTRQNGVRTDYI